jgi:hypothetical protein
MAVAEMLGLTERDLTEKSKACRKLNGLSGVCYGYEWIVDIHLGPRVSGVAPLALSNARLHFTGGPLPWEADLLLGQYDALERLYFIQRNKMPDPEFVRRVPG